MASLQIALSVLCLLIAVWLVVLIVRDRTPDNLALNALGGGGGRADRQPGARHHPGHG